MLDQVQKCKELGIKAVAVMRREEMCEDDIQGD